MPLTLPDELRLPFMKVVLSYLKKHYFKILGGQIDIDREIEMLKVAYAMIERAAPEHFKVAD